MKITVQRVTEASVEVDGVATGEIGAGLLVLVGIEGRDTLDDVQWVAKKVWNMRLWANAEDKPWMESASSKKLEVLVVSQFTLHARFKGNKPDFHLAMPPAEAETVYEQFVAELNSLRPADSKPVATGKFGAKMAVKLVNDGPVTIQLDSHTVRFPRKIPLPVPQGGGIRNAQAQAEEVDVPWVIKTGEATEEKIVPLEADADGMIGPPEGALPPGTPMTSLMFTVPEDKNAGDAAEVPLPSGMSVMVRVPADKGASDVLQLQVPQALMDPEFQQKQMAARQLQQQGLAIIDFKVPEDKKAGDECNIRLPSGLTIKVVVPEGKVAGDMLKVRVPRAALEQRKQVVGFKIPEGKKAGDQCQVRLASGQVLTIQIPEGKGPGDVLQLSVPAAMNQVQVPPGTPMEKITWTIPEGKGPGDKVSIELPSGMAVNITIEEGKKAGDILELSVPRAFLDPKFREKQAIHQEQQRQAALRQQQALSAIQEEPTQESAPKRNQNQQKKKKKNKGKKKK